MPKSCRFLELELEKFMNTVEFKMMGVKVCLLEFILFVSFCCFALSVAAQTTDPSEVAALRAIKSELIDPMKHLNDWNQGDPCTSNWTGILCFDPVGTDGYMHIKGLQLLNMNLSGYLAPELGQLSHIQVIDFMWNEITGSIPREIGKLASLRLL
ncbi:PREDICTED: probable LRR receptor-like serine/threonine-protein kinase At1g06840, partial [Nelumbo nucifera]